jgi:hypothetical protein
VEEQLEAKDKAERSGINDKGRIDRKEKGTLKRKSQ